MTEENRVIVLIDFENLVINIPIGLPGQGYSITRGLTKIIEDISQQGEIIGLFAFTPSHLAMEWGETLHELGFYIISCPRVRNEQERIQDTTDSILIKFGQMMTKEIKGLTHIYLGSGDADFSPFIQQTNERGLRTIIIAGSLRSLSGELISLAERIFILS